MNEEKDGSMSLLIQSNPNNSGPLSIRPALAAEAASDEPASRSRPRTAADTLPGTDAKPLAHFGSAWRRCVVKGCQAVVSIANIAAGIALARADMAASGLFAAAALLISAITVHLEAPET
jgi:hypothetical protein